MAAEPGRSKTGDEPGDTVISSAAPSLKIARDAVPSQAPGYFPPVPPRTPAIVAEVAARIGGHDPWVTPEPSQLPNFEGYEVVARLGRGGMGVVYCALQKNPPRTVALKLISTGSQASSQELARFRNEVEAIAGLKHPNIVPIYEVGEQDGQAYFSMEFVEGGALSDRLAGKPQPARIAAQFVRDCARAVQWAHDQGIVHRDLKPSNILLAPCGPNTGLSLSAADAPRYVPKITDFGLSKRLVDPDSFRAVIPSEADTMCGDAGEAGLQELGNYVTRQGQILGTPNYMAPEQIEGRAKPAVDIYGLGGILYEMLTGRPPFGGVTAEETLQQVRFQEPVSPRQLQPAIPRDMETICLKCLAKLPVQRYPSASALADDLDRFLQGQPILARPASTGDYLLKWMKRSPALATLVVVSLAAVAVISAGGWWTSARLRVLTRHLQIEATRADQHTAMAREQRDEARRQKAEAQRLRAEAETQRHRAETNLDQARRIVDELVIRLSEDPRLRAQGMSGLRHELLESAVTYYRAFIATNRDNLAVTVDLGRAYCRLAAILGQLGDKNEAISLYQEAISLLSSRTKKSPSPDLLRELAQSHRGLGSMYISTNRSLADRPLRKARSIQDQLEKDYPGNTDYERDLAETATVLGIVYRDTERFQAAEPEFTRALEVQQRLAVQLPDDDTIAVALCRTYRNLGWLYRLTHRLPQAKDAHQSALRLAEKLSTAHPGDPVYERELGICHWEIGNREYREGNVGGARETYRGAILVQEQLVERYPEVPAYRIDLGLTCQWLSRCHLDVGEFDEALSWSKQAEEMMTPALKMEPENTRARHLLIEVLLARSEIEDRLGHTADGGRYREQAIELDAARSWSGEILRSEELARTGDYEMADTMARRIAAGNAVTAKRLSQLARIYALCVTAAKNDADLSASDRDDRSSSFASRSVEWARRAYQAGAYADRNAAQELRTHSDFEILRAREDFQKVVAELPHDDH